ncbi:SRPBCC family protein [Ramlibacter albus]|uniref:SRPBCC family protein n=1 Tax=Ramlibacter albus TaxID=2079448 RepID=A0A923S0H0_9BURK|nr:SRPBCC family protein [Ramlibacter albus]MBC5763250.1 SRPBCC family protein [Ramlibacter albus]
MADGRFQSFTQAVVIAAPPTEVYDYVTNAAQWKQWHPATRNVRDVPNRPLQLGETMTEHIHAGFRNFEAVWRVTQWDRPSLWRIETTTRYGASAVTYRLQPLGAGCRFERTCEFHSEGAWRLLDGNLARWLLKRQAARALSNLHDHFL